MISVVLLGGSCMFPFPISNLFRLQFLMVLALLSEFQYKSRCLLSFYWSPCCHLNATCISYARILLITNIFIITMYCLCLRLQPHVLVSDFLWFLWQGLWSSSHFPACMKIIRYFLLAGNNIRFLRYLDSLIWLQWYLTFFRDQYGKKTWVFVSALLYRIRLMNTWLWPVPKFPL